MEVDGPNRVKASLRPIKARQVEQLVQIRLNYMRELVDVVERHYL